MKYKILLIACLLSFLTSEAQNKNKKDSGYKIEVNIPNSIGEYLHLVRYSNGRPYSIDSIAIPPQGKAVFRSSEQLPQGQYLIYKRPDIQMEILLGKEQSNIRIDLNKENLQNSKITGSQDTKLYWDYIRYINHRNEELNLLNQKYEKTNNESDRRIVLDSIIAKEKHILRYMHSQVQQHSDQWFASFLKGTIPIENPISKPASIEDVQVNKDYLRKHYFDNINLADPRFWNTNYFPRMIEDYLSVQVPQNPDTVAYEASKLVAKAASDSTAFKEMLSYTLNSAMHSKYMGMENVWARLAEDYILDKNISWIEKEKEAQIRSLYEALKFNRIGMPAVNLHVATINGDSINTNDIESEYTLIYFYNPTCGHCKHTSTTLRDHIAPKYKDNVLRIIAFNIGNSEEAWKNYIIDNNLSEWINCSDHNYQSAYWMYYDTSSVPSIYILDKNKRIIARKIAVEDIGKLLDYYIK